MLSFHSAVPIAGPSSGERTPRCGAGTPPESGHRHRDSPRGRFRPPRSARLYETFVLHGDSGPVEQFEGRAAQHPGIDAPHASGRHQRRGALPDDLVGDEASAQQRGSSCSSCHRSLTPRWWNDRIVSPLRMTHEHPSARRCSTACRSGFVSAVIAIPFVWLDFVRIVDTKIARKRNLRTAKLRILLPIFRLDEKNPAGLSERRDFLFRACSGLFRAVSDCSGAGAFIGRFRSADAPAEARPAAAAVRQPA